MVRPQSPEVVRSAKTPLDPDSIESELEARRPVRDGAELGPIPEENRPGHHPERDQDRPDLHAFVRRFGSKTSEDSPAEGDRAERDRLDDLRARLARLPGFDAAEAKINELLDTDTAPAAAARIAGYAERLAPDSVRRFAARLVGTGSASDKAGDR